MVEGKGPGRCLTSALLLCWAVWNKGGIRCFVRRVSECAQACVLAHLPRPSTSIRGVLAAARHLVLICEHHRVSALVNLGSSGAGAAQVTVRIVSQVYNTSERKKC